jgi:transposase
MEKELISYQAGDLPVLYTIVKSLDIASSVNKNIKVHGNWEGTLPGEILELWLCYILSHCDHRLSGAEEWAENNLDFLRILSDNPKLSSQDFTDDKLGLLLDYFSVDASWQHVETQVNGKILEIYRLEQSDSLSTFRLDAAPMQSYGKVAKDGLLQYGYHKHHADLPQFKLKLCTLDNEVNNFAHPICHLTVNGKVADDELYIPIIEKSKEVLSGIESYSTGNLYVGDSKFGALSNRLFVQGNKDYYLMPLSKVQLSAKEREELIDKHNNKEHNQKIFRTEKGKEVLIAEGFEVVQQMEVEIEGQSYEWQERRLFVCSSSYAKSQQSALDRKLSAAEESIIGLTIRKQGKQVLKTKEDYEEAINGILKANNVENLLKVEIQERITKTEKRAYGSRPKRTETKSEFQISVQQQEEEIKKRKEYMGWQVYATNAAKDLLPFEKCVWKYRYQSNIESRFDDVRNKMAALLPVFLQKDNRIIGLVNILLLALKVCSVLEYKVAKSLQDQKKKLHGVYEGNPKRETDRPSVKRILTAFKSISFSLIFENNDFQFVLMTKLKPVQKKILQLLELDTEIYTGLNSKIQMFFSNKNIIET